MFKFLGSLTCAIALIGATLLFVIAGTFLESWSGSHQYAAVLTYSNPLFRILLGLYFVNILFSALSRWPFQRKHVPFLLTHLGLLMLLTGVFVKNHMGIQGTCSVMEGAGTSRIFVPQTFALHIENRKEVVVAPLKKGKLGNIDTTGDLKLSVVEWIPHAEESLEGFIKGEKELTLDTSAYYIYDKGYGGYAMIARLPDQELLTPLTRSWTILPLPKKREEATPRIRLLASFQGHTEIVTLGYDQYAQGLKWPILNGTYLVRFQACVKEIPVHIRLREATRINYPGTDKAYSYQARLLVDEAEANLSMNHVYEKEGYRFYLASLIKRPGQAGQVQIVVNYDPAKYWLTYPGAILVALGIALLYLGRRYV